MKIKWDETDYPSIFIRLSDELAKVRSKLSESVYKEGTEKHRGEKEHSISQLGIFGELVARHIMEIKGIDYTEAPIIDFSPVVEADIVLHNEFGDDYLIDVKGLKTKATYFRVNYKSHNNSNKPVSHYLFCLLYTSDAADE